MQRIVVKLDELADLREATNAMRIDYETKRAEILKAVQAELDALDAEYEPLLNSTEEKIAQLEEEIRQEVVTLGSSVKGKSFHAVFARGRISWDTKELDRYAETHPEIVEFRKQGEPTVQLRLVKPARQKDLT